MPETFGDRLKHAWNAFLGKNAMLPDYSEIGPGYSYSYGRGDRVFLRRSSERSIIASIYNTIAIDCASVDIFHVKLDDNKRFMEEIKSGLNDCLTVEANIDQAGRALRQDIFQSLCERGVIGIVPVETSLNPNKTGGYDIKSLRVGEIVSWYPKHVTINLYNENRGLREEITVPKSIVAIPENPLYSVMNEPNSTLQRLIRKLSLLDSMDEKMGASKLDIIIQLPYVIKTESRRREAEKRRKDIEEQLTGSQYGIAYTDGTERITQLNRPAENNLLAQIKYLTQMLYGQLGLTPAVFDGSADEKTMLNYMNRTIEPMLAAVTEEMHRKFLTKTARSQGQAIEYFRDPFRLVATEDIAEIADKFTRNEILTSNEVRAIMGMKPVNDPKADELRNKNLPAIKDEMPMLGDNQNES